MDRNNMGASQGLRHQAFDATTLGTVYRQQLGGDKVTTTGVDEVIRIAKDLNIAITRARSNGATVILTVPAPAETPFPEVEPPLAVSITVTT